MILKELKKTAKNYEVYSQKTTIHEVHLQKNKINFFDTTKNTGYGIRIKTKGLGFSSSNVLSDSIIKQTINNALINSKISKEIDFTFPSKKSYKKTKTIDKKIKQKESVKEYAESVLDAIPSDVLISFGKIRAYDSVINITNSEELDLEREETNFMVELSIIVEKNGKKVEFWPHEYRRRMQDLPVSNIKEWIKISKDQLAAVHPKTEKATIIFSPNTVLDGLGSTVGYHATGVAKLNDISKFSPGEKVSSNDLTIISDGLYPYGLMTSGFDDEGNPQKKNLLIKDGIFKNYIYDQFFALKDRKKSTGNGLRQGSTFFVFGGKYNNNPINQVSNLYVKPGKKSLDKLISEVDHGILIKKFSWLAPNSTTGQFSSEIRVGYYIDKGEITKPVNGGLVAGNFFNLINNISGISDKSVITSGGNVLSGICPYIRFEDIQIAGS